MWSLTSPAYPISPCSPVHQAAHSDENCCSEAWISQRVPGEQRELMLFSNLPNLLQEGVCVLWGCRSVWVPGEKGVLVCMGWAGGIRENPEMTTALFPKCQYNHVHIALFLAYSDIPALFQDKTWDAFFCGSFVSPLPSCLCRITEPVWKGNKTGF